MTYENYLSTCRFNLVSGLGWSVEDAYHWDWEPPELQEYIEKGYSWPEALGELLDTTAFRYLTKEYQEESDRIQGEWNKEYKKHFGKDG